MLKNLLFMLCWNASNYVQLCCWYVPIMLMQHVNQLIKTAPKMFTPTKLTLLIHPSECSAVFFIISIKASFTTVRHESSCASAYSALNVGF